MGASLLALAKSIYYLFLKVISRLKNTAWAHQKWTKTQDLWRASWKEIRILEKGAINQDNKLT